MTESIRAHTAPTGLGRFGYVIAFLLLVAISVGLVATAAPRAGRLANGGIVALGGVFMLLGVAAGTIGPALSRRGPTRLPTIIERAAFFAIGLGLFVDGLRQLLR